MGSTPRQHRYQIPMSTRSTDVAELAKCPGAFLLKHVHEDDQAEATYFELGSALHEGIELTILNDWDQDKALKHVTDRLNWWLVKIEDLDSQPIETSSRGVNTIIDDADRMMRSWFKWVHPDSDKRHPIYDECEWPPRVEVPFTRMAEGCRYPVWGSVDAIFQRKSPAIAISNGANRLIVDWKSGTSKQRDSNQLDFYRFGSGMQRAEAAFHHLDRKQKRSVIQEADPYPGDRVVIRRIQQAEREKEQIINGGPVQFNPDWWCNFCVVREHCPKEGTDSAGNRATLRRTLKLVRPMETIERVA